MVFNITSTAYLTKKIRLWGKSNYADYPWRETSNNWHALVAEIMLQRTKASQVVPAYLKFVQDFPTIESYLKSNNNREKNFFTKLGLSWRYELFQDTVSFIHKNGIPDDKIELIKVPGVGDYIASAYLSFHRGKREIIIDSNTVRLFGRFFGFPYNNETRRKKWCLELANKVTPQRNVGSFNYALLDFSMNICIRNPRCTECMLTRKCYYYMNSVNPK